jgi:TQXA domain-containing protein
VLVLRRAFGSASWWQVVVPLLASSAFLLQAAPAGAVVRHGPPPTRARTGGNTDMTVSNWFPGQSVTGFIGNSSFDPVAEGYPTSDPTGDPRFSPKNEGFAGVIHGQPTGGGPALNLYCIDINTDTWGGIGYVLGTWDASNVMNVGYVARILNEYYPNTDEPANLTDLNQRAAAVQAAIWFFSDRYVVSTSDPVHSATVAIVDRIISEGPLVKPPPPSLTITPSALNSPRKVVGPFTVTTDHPPATVTVTGGTMYSNRAGTVELGDGTTATVPSGQKIWLRSSGTSTAVLQAIAQATVPSGNVYLYDGNTQGVNDAQRLILAEDATLKATVGATATFLPSGGLVVNKTIAGAAAGSQGQVVIHVACDDGVPRRDFVIPGGTPAGTTSRTYRHIAAGTTCTVLETANGSVVGTDVVVTGDGQEVTIAAGMRKTVDITDTYTAVPSPGPSSLLVTKTIAGPLAGHQGAVTIHVVCNNVALSPDFTIAAGTQAGSFSQSFGPVAPGSVCTVTEAADGSTATVAAVVSGSGANVTVPADAVVPVNVMDVYEEAPSPTPDLDAGSLRVTKTIAGPAGGRQGSIAILVACGDPAHTYAFVIPAHTHAGSVSRVFSGLPAGSRCTVTETANGHTSTVNAVTAGRRKTATIAAGRTATVHLTDTFFAVSAVSVTG